MTDANLIGGGQADRALFGEISGRAQMPDERGSEPLPLIVAIHGGTYTSRYFDIPGYSLLDRAAANGIPILAIDRPGYGRAPILSADQSTIDGHARFLTQALEEAWRRYGQGCSGIVLIGHSIGAATAATIASNPGNLPVIGLAISGVGLRTPEGDGERWAALPDIPLVDVPLDVKDYVMFGPPGSFDAGVVTATHAAHGMANRGELLDITMDWHTRVQCILARINVPVHYRQGEFDRLWIVDQGEVEIFAKALASSKRVDAALMPGAGHCIDFHYAGAALQLQQLGFALQCASEAGALASVEMLGPKWRSDSV